MRQQRYKRLRAVFWKIQKCIHTYIIFKSQLKTLKIRALLFYIPADESFIAADRLVIVYDLCNREHYVSKFMVPNFMMELLFIFRLLLIQRTSYDFIKTVMHSKYKTRAKNVYICEICCFLLLGFSYKLSLFRQLSTLHATNTLCRRPKY